MKLVTYNALVLSSQCTHLSSIHAGPHSLFSGYHPSFAASDSLCIAAQTTATALSSTATRAREDTRVKSLYGVVSDEISTQSGLFIWLYIKHPSMLLYYCSILKVWLCSSTVNLSRSQHFLYFFAILYL